MTSDDKRDPAELLLWLDMEMTGLDPKTCVPLEVAAIVTDQNLQELDSVEFVIRASDEALAAMSDFVRQMHTDNGLLERVRAARLDLAAADEALATFVARWFDPGLAILAGNTIGQDRLFLSAYMPRVMEYLHYRTVDVSSVKELVRRWYGEGALSVKQNAHTAMADIRESIAELNHYRANHFR